MSEFFTQLYDEATLTITVIVILMLMFLAQYLLRRAFKRFEKSRVITELEDTTNYRFMYYAMLAAIYLTGIGFAIWNIPTLKHVAQTMLASAGILAVVVGFAAQQALGNIVSGIFIVMFKPYRINDRITVKDTLSGIVEDINLRHTIIRNFENQRIIIPNAIISNEVLVNSNYNDDKICRFIEVGISYSSDIDKAKEIIGQEIENHPFNIDIRSEEDLEKGAPRVMVKVLALGESSVNLRGWAWASEPASGFMMQCEVLESIKKRFDKEGIVIPFPQRTVSYLNSKDS